MKSKFFCKSVLAFFAVFAVALLGLGSFAAENNHILARNANVTFRVYFDLGVGPPSLIGEFEQGQFSAVFLPPQPTDPTNAGRAFLGWSPDPATHAVNYDTTFIALWSISQLFTATFDLSGGNVNGDTSNVQVGNITHGNLVPTTQIPAPVRAGYTFTAWNPNPAATPITANQTFTAQWTAAQTHTVTFNLDGGNIGGSAQNPTVAVASGTTVPTAQIPQNPVRAGHTFSAWNPNPATTTITANQTFTAQWITGQAHTVTFNLGGGNIGGSTQNPTVAAANGTTVTTAQMPQNPVRTGYTFSAWNPNPATTTITANQTFTAQWIAGQAHTVTFNLNGGNIGGSTQNPTVVVANATTVPTAQMPQNPVRTGYTFNAWNPNPATTTITSNQTFTAQWTVGQNHTATFDLGGGNIGGSTQNPTVTVPNGTIIQTTQIPQSPVRAGYTFTAWYPNPATTTITANQTFTAQWTLAQLYTVTFNLNGGNVGGSIVNPQIHNISHGTILPAQDQPFPLRTGYMFGGWNPSPATTQITENLTFTAIWNPVTVQPVPPIETIPPTAVLVTEVVHLSQGGLITVGGNIISLPEHFGIYHVNENNVSVLPARAILSVLFGADPYDPYLFVWDALTSTFAIDPSNRNISLQVGSTVMHVGGIPRQILSGEGVYAFPYAAYVDPINSRLFVPLRAIAESVGFHVHWDAATATVILTPPM